MIKNNIQVYQNSDLNRKDETILNRLRIGHRFVTHNHLMVRKDAILYVNHVEWSSLSNTY